MPVEDISFKISRLFTNNNITYQPKKKTSAFPHSCLSPSIEKIFSALHITAFFKGQSIKENNNNNRWFTVTG